MSRSAAERLRDALDHASHALKLADQLALTEGGLDRILRQAVLYDLLLIGTTISKVPAEIKGLEPSIPWGAIVVTRNRIVHAYWQIDMSIIGTILADHLAPLIAALDRLLALVETAAE